MTAKVSSLSTNAPKEPDTQVINDEKYQNIVKHTRSLFDDLTKSFKSSAFGGYSDEQKYLFAIFNFGC
jgi:hypothetical protein